MDFLDRLQKIIKEQKLFDASDSLLLAVSGGMDSVAMVHALHFLGYRIAIAHCNFQLRAEESNGDEQFVRQLAEKLQIPFFFKRFETNKRVEETRDSVQMVARELRYAWFEEVKAQNNFNYLLTAHHQDDVVETILLNLARGTGLSGLHGILPKQNGIVRPFVSVPQREIETYVKHNHLEWREDSSNASEKYARNLIRLKVIPLLKEINPAIVQNVFNTSQHLLEVEKCLEDTLEAKKESLVSKKGVFVKIDIKAVKQQEGSQLLLHFILREFNFTHDVVKEILKTAQTGAVFYSSSHRALFDREYLIVDVINKGTWKPVLLEKGQSECGLWDQVSLKAEHCTEVVFKKGEIVLDYDKLLFPLQVRKWQAGDRFIPLGMTGYKKVSDFLVDLKINLFEKEHILVLVSDGNIAAVLGYRPSQNFCAEETTKSFLRLKIS